MNAGEVIGGVALIGILALVGLAVTADDDPQTLTSEAFASRWSDAELVQNVEDVATIRRWHLAARRKVRHLGNGVDLARFRPGSLPPGERSALRAEWGVDGDTVVIGTVGRLVAEKGYPELFTAVLAMAPSVRLVVVGGADSDKADSLDPALVERARADGIVFLGHRSDVDRLLGAFDVFVLASHREGQPRAAMEAAASGLPIVATDIRGCRQVVDDGVTGSLVPVADAAALAGALTELVTSPQRRAAMGRAAAAKAGAEFDDRAVVAGVMACYADVARRKGIELA